MRKSGIDIIGDVPWGTHICHLYQSQEDLIEILVPYFKAGLENYEFCVWVTSPPLDVKEAMAALKKKVKNLEDYIKKGQIEIIEGNKWYAKTGKFEADKVLDGWLRKEKKAKKRGFDGLRLAGNTSWLEESDWKNFIDYEGKVQNDIGKKWMIAICSYSLDKCGTAEAIDVTSHHQLALIKKEASWMLIENSEHRKKEEALQQSIRMREKILEFSPEVIGIIDAKGNILDVNKRLDDWVGYKPEEVLGKNFLELPFLLDESKAIAKEKLFQSLLGKDVGPYELDFITKRGEKRVGRILVSPIRDKNGELIEELVMASDITESKQAKEALEESEKKYRTLAESAMDGIYIINPEGFEYVNPAFERILGYKAEEVCDKKFNFFELIHPEDRKLIAKRKEARKKGKKLPSIYSFRVLTKNGKLKHVEVDTVPLPGEKVKILGIMRDMTERKKAEEALRESEELFRSIVENSHAGVLIVRDSYRFVYANDELCRILGYSQEEIIGQDFRKFLDEESKQLVSERYVRRQRGEKVPPRYEFNIVRKNGEKRRVEIISTVIKDSAGRTQSVAQILDITERKQAEKALKQSESDYRGLFENAHDAIIVFIPKNEIIIDVNKSACEMYGFRRSELIGMSLEAISKDVSRGKSRIKETQKKGVYRNFETVHYRKDGSEIFVEINAAVVNYKGQQAILSANRDITERKKAEESLKIEKARLDRLFESAQEGIVMFDKEGRVIRVNSEFVRLFGHTVDEALGRSVDELVVPKEELDKGLLITKKVARGENIAFEAVRQRKDGTLIDVSVLASPIIVDGDVRAAYAIYRDITDRKRAEERILRQSAVLKAINKVFRGTLICETEEEVARICLAVAEELTGSQFGFIGKLNERGRLDTIAQSDTGWEACKIARSDAVLMINDMEIRGIWGKVIKDEQSLVVNDPSSHPSRVGTPKGHPSINAFLGVPLKEAEKTIGLIALANKKSGYDLADKQAIEDLSVAFLEALNRKRAEEIIKKRKSQLELVHKIQNEIPMNLDIETILKSAAESIGRSFGYHKVSVNLFDKDTDEIVHIVGWNKSGPPTPRGHRQKVGEGLIGTAAKLKRIIVANDVSKEPAYIAYYQTKTKSELTVPLIVQDHLVGVLDIQDVKKEVFTIEDISVLQSVANYIAYVIDEKKTEEVLRISEEKYRNLVELSPDAILFLDMKGVITSCNTMMTKGTGYSKEEIVGKHLAELELLPKKDIPNYIKLFNTAAKGKVPQPFEVSWHHKDGTFYLAEVRIGFIKEKGRNVGVQVVARDITERKQAEEKIKAALKEKEVMLREIHHRVKNNMQVISSLLRLQSRQFKDKKILDSFDVSQNRIRSMALIHESLYKSKDLARINFSDYINRLTIHLFSIYKTGVNSIELKVEVKDVFLDINRAIPCGLIINELVSNSLKHAFLEGRKGEISVKMDMDKQGKYVLIIKDTGIGFPEDVDFHQTETLGLQLVTDLVKQLNGSIKLKRTEGTEFRIVF